MAQLRVTTDAHECMPLEQVSEDNRYRVIQKKVWRLRSLFETDLRTAFEYLDDLQTHEAWRYLREPDMNQLIENRCCVSPAFVQQLREGYTALVSQGHTGKITKTEAIRARRAQHPDETQQATADAVGCNQSLVAKVITKSSQWEEKVITPPDWIRRHDDQTAFRQLDRVEQQRLIDLPPDQRRGAVRRAAVAAGKLRVPTPLQQAQKAFVRLTHEDRIAFVNWLPSQMTFEPRA